MTDFFPGILNFVNLLTLGPSFIDFNKTHNVSTNSKILRNESPNLSLSNKLNESSDERYLEKEVRLGSVTIHYGRYEGTFVSANVINLSVRHLSKDKVSLLSKGLKLVPTPKNINKAQIKEEIEVDGRKYRVMWHFRNDHREFDINLLKKKKSQN